VSMASTPHQVAEIIAQNRIRKAMQLADTLCGHDFSLEQVRSLDDHGWHIVAASAGTTPPSADTREIVMRVIEAYVIRQAATGRKPFTKFRKENPPCGVH
jgi:hypothetical protein